MTVSESPTATAVRPHHVVLYGMPTWGFFEILKEKVPPGTSVSWFGYDEPAERLRAAFATADVILTNRLTKETPVPEGLSLVQLPGAGSDEIDFDAVPPSVPLCNVYEHEAGVAEFVLLTMLLERGPDILGADSSFRAGSWSQSGRLGAPPADEVHGRTLGLVGLGRIGRAVASRAAAFGMTVIAANRTIPETPPRDVSIVYPLNALREMLSQCDFVLICVSLNRETEGLISGPELGSMSRETYLINVARGPIIDEDALFQALKDGNIRGAHLDVWYSYPDSIDAHPAPSKHDFASLPNVRMTPHIAGWTEGTLARRQAFVVENVIFALQGQVVVNRIR